MKNLQASGFAALGVPENLCQHLVRHQIIEPTPIQAASIPVQLKGHDLVGVAQTGTGKTLAFGLPIAAQIKPGQQALIIAPTRELAQQICQTFAKLEMRSVLIVGGASYNNQVRDLRRQPPVIVATPGRLIDHLEQGSISLGRVAFVVLDEADRMLDMGFAPAIRRILDVTPKVRQTLLFSATMPKEIADLASRYLTNPQRIDIEGSGRAADTVSHEVAWVAHEEKQEVLGQILTVTPGPILVFTRTKHGARKLAKAVRDMGHRAGELHARLTLAQRRESLHSFVTGATRVLVATDIVARGIDVKGITLVVNYDVPEHPDDYIHRIGRTGRAGHAGNAIMLALPEQRRDVRDIEKLLGDDIPTSQLSTIKPTMTRSAAQSPKRQDDGVKAPFQKGPRGSRGGKKRREQTTPSAAPQSMATPISRTGHRGWSGKPKKRFGR